MSVRQRLIDRASGPIREMAIRRVKAKIAQQNRLIEDYTEDEREELVAAEEATIKRRLWLLPYGALLALLGIA